jgi:hypothetical protein
MMRGIGVVHAGWGAAAARGATCERDLLEILLAAHAELTAATGAQVTELRALLLAGDKTDRALARGSFSGTILFRLVRRRAPHDASDVQILRTADIQRLARVVSDYRNELTANRDQLATLVNELAPGLTAQPGMGPVTAAKVILNRIGIGATPTPIPDSDRVVGGR